MKYIDHVAQLSRLKDNWENFEQTRKKNNEISFLVSGTGRRVSKDIIMQPYQKLKEIFPEHELLKVASILPGGQDMAFFDEFYQKFSDPEDEWVSDAYLRYAAALNSAIDMLSQKRKSEIF